MLEVDSLVYSRVLSYEITEALGRLCTSRQVFGVDLFKDLDENVVAQVE